MTSAIDKLKALQRHTVHIADWDADVEFRVLPALEVVELHESLLAIAEDSSLAARVAFFVNLLSRCMVGFDTPENKDLLSRAKLDTLLALSGIAMRIHGFKPAGIETPQPESAPKKTA